MSETLKEIAAQISAATYCPKTRTLRVRGWRLGPIDEIRTRAGSFETRHFTKNLRRDDVLAKHPEATIRRPGWMSDSRLPEGVETPTSVRCELFVEGASVATLSRTLSAKEEENDVPASTLGALAALNGLIAGSDEPFEGGMFYLGSENFSPCIAPHPGYQEKRARFLSAATGHRSALEIGFNGGHSAAYLLSELPTLSYFGADLGEHGYAHKAAGLLSERFAGRFQARFGDSRESLPWLKAEQPDLRFDFIHVDGGHTDGICRADIANVLAMAEKGATMVVDDTNDPVLFAVAEDFVRLGYLTPRDDRETATRTGHTVYDVAKTL